MKVEEIMKKEVISVEVPNSRANILELFEKHAVKSLPVLKKGKNNLVGIVTQADLIKNPSEDQLALLMTRDPITVSAKEDIKNAIKLMIDNDLRRLPVTDNDKSLKGMLSIGDIISKGISKLDIEKSIKNYILRTFTSVWEGTPLPIVPHIMRLAKKQALLVLNGKGNLSGIISQEDLIKASEIVSENTKSNISAETEGDFSWDASSTLLITQHKLKLPSDKIVRDVMEKKLITAIESTSIKECADKMRKYNISQLPVLDARGILIGLITDNSLLKALYE
ncbi:MAG: CBS domain-containing protein [Candidatus Helarchaeota archaeon]|nr:CBS domain-containing protein [Candidatus Helarchaeota archaeon]